MPKRQYQQNRSFKDYDSTEAEVSCSEATAETPNIKREFILTQSADDSLDGVVRLLSRATGANVTKSHFLRAVLKTLSHAMPELEREASQLGRLKRPSNARGNEVEREEYEQRLADAILTAVRSSQPPKGRAGSARKSGASGKRPA